MTRGTIEETYEHRVVKILKRLLGELSPDMYYPKELERKLLEHRSRLGELLIEDMLVWMSEEDWVNLINDG